MVRFCQKVRITEAVAPIILQYPILEIIGMNEAVGVVKTI